MQINEISARYNGMLRDQLRLENESHVKDMTEALRDQAEELNTEWSAEMDLKLSTQQGFYQIELARAVARLGGLSVMVDGVASAGVCLEDSPYCIAKFVMWRLPLRMRWLVSMRNEPVNLGSKSLLDISSLLSQIAAIPQCYL